MQSGKTLIDCELKKKTFFGESMIRKAFKTLHLTTNYLLQSTGKWQTNLLVYL